MDAGLLPPARPAEGPLAQRQGPRRPAVLVQLEVALAEERASLNGLFEQRAAGFVQQAAMPHAEGECTGPKA